MQLERVSLRRSLTNITTPKPEDHPGIPGRDFTNQPPRECDAAIYRGDPEPDGWGGQPGGDQPAGLIGMGGLQGPERPPARAGQRERGTYQLPGEGGSGPLLRPGPQPGVFKP